MNYFKIAKAKAYIVDQLHLNFVSLITSITDLVSYVETIILDFSSRWEHWLIKISESTEILADVHEILVSHWFQELNVQRNMSESLLQTVERLHNTLTNSASVQCDLQLGQL